MRRPMIPLQLARRLVLVVVAAIVMASCGSAEPAASIDDIASDEIPDAIPGDAVVIRASTDIGLGNERLLFGIGSTNGERFTTPEVGVTVEVYPEHDPTAIQTAEASWVWIVLNGIGLYRTAFDFDTPGIWIATATPQGANPLESFSFNVAADPVAPAMGEIVPNAPTPTLDDLTIEALTTDPDPDLSFYELSLEEALANENRTVLVFSTPAYCRTSACGPLLDHVKDISGDYPDVNFLHVEVFTDLLDDNFAPDAAHLAPAAGPDWFNLPSEPWVFVLDPAGSVVGRFEGVLDPVELQELLG